MHESSAEDENSLSHTITPRCQILWKALDGWTQARRWRLGGIGRRKGEGGARERREKAK